MPAAFGILDHPKLRRLALGVRSASDCRTDFVRIIDERVAALDHLFKRKPRVRSRNKEYSGAHPQITGGIDGAAHQELPIGEPRGRSALYAFPSSTLRQ